MSALTSPFPATDPRPFSRLVTVEATTSTNDDLRAALTGPDGRLLPDTVDWPHLSALRAVSQTAGRGRANRTWTTPPSGALTFSLVLRPLVPAARLGWLPLLAGLATSRALAPWLEGTGWSARTKWPNDVVLRPGSQVVKDVPGWGRSRKVAGILAELVARPGAPADPNAVPADRRQCPAVIVGIGVNVAQDAEELPVPWAASLASVGAAAPGRARGCDAGFQDPGRAGPRPPRVEAVMREIGSQLVVLLDRWEAVGGDPDAGDGALGEELRDACVSLGARLRVVTPDTEVVGTAVGIEPGLVLRTRGADGAPQEVVISAGDVTLARSAADGDPEPGPGAGDTARPAAAGDA